jgi:uncharacterized protein (DUF2249 family)
MPTLDVRDVPPSDRHPRIKTTLHDVDSGDTLELVNDHDPKPLFYEMQAEEDAFDADADEVEEVGPDEYRAYFPKI